MFIKSNLKVQESPAKISKLKFYVQYTAIDCQILENDVFKVFPSKIRDPYLLSHSGVKVTEGFPLISNLALTRRIATIYFRSDFFSSESLKQNKVLILRLELKNTFSLQNGP